MGERWGRHPGTLADRLGMTIHCSPLRMRLLRLWQRSPPETGDTFEDWLLSAANARGADIVSLSPRGVDRRISPEWEDLGDEELAAALCLPHNVDRPHLLRPAAQLISRGVIDVPRFIRISKRERIEAVIGPIARAALRVDPRHPGWRALADAFPQCPPRDEPVIHWTRIALPVFDPRRPNARSWRLAA